MLQTDRRTVSAVRRPEEHTGGRNDGIQDLRRWEIDVIGLFFHFPPNNS